ncbi:uracil-DNA glycosylase [Halocella sp. SP3-1]|uniref:uracil-DNA glycosylase n=1 Tax=Halocella sp. SP3-1 TaxID=2382161 RepID=UPI000F75139F|nr:uracil-DNA glycosylase [Halocella sp. SP3-1]AZO96407.1 uracil-DNA glycosylase [Halocella sp. SP3-1]
MEWEELEQACQACQRCSLYKTRNKLVFGGGNRDASLMFIGEGPGRQEDATGIPFVGKSGQLLDKILAAIDVKREDVYIGNIVKCRPPNNRDPKEDEKKACLPYLRNQVHLIRPRIIVCLGRVAAQSIISPDFKITRQHGSWTERKGYYLTATYHPSALLRVPSRKKEAWEDFKKIKEKLASVQKEP